MMTMRIGSFNMGDAKERELRFAEVLPYAAVVSAISDGESGGMTPVNIGIRAREILSCEDQKSPAYRIAMATTIAAQITDVQLETLDFGRTRFIVTYKTLSREPKVESIRTPLLNDYRLGHLTRKIWDHKGPDGRYRSIGMKMLLFKHNDPPRGGDLSSNGFRTCVYAEPLR